ncbi:MAG: CUAEP/CCAEP-tail radical SAM protein [Acidobacteriota bacterium]|nr:CUAEP/CCAEP-tail radical SAM protein [Blastocatellia bacterium]MDW8239184.1 CUAEP/CCAEP-tail radical SAM protein [Acidobacteriota bacterium]
MAGVLHNNMNGKTILLVSCYELGHQPLGVAFPCGFLQQVGYATDTLDIAVEPLDETKIANAWFVGISVPMHTALRLGVRVAERIRHVNPRCHICFYGLYASLNADYLLEHGADFIIGGEYETPLVALIDALANGGSLDIAGISRRGHVGRPYVQRQPFVAPQRSSLPPLSKYARLEHQGTQRLVGTVEASRGCLHHCRHCPIPPVYGGRFFIVPTDIVLNDIRQLVEAGATHITFGDPDFLNGPGHARRVVRALHNEFPALTFDFTAKVEHLLKHQAILPELAESGCLFVVSAFESLSDTVLAHLEKGHTRADIHKLLDVVTEAKLALRPTWVPFTPWTTLDDYIDILQFVRDHKLIDYVDPVQYTIRLLVPPGSNLLRQPAIQPFLGALDHQHLSYRWRHPDPCMDDLHKTVSALVEQAAQSNEHPAKTFDRVCQVAYAMRGDEMPELISTATRDQTGRAPRLTEPWFCCAEPTTSQFDALQRRRGI